MAVTKIFCDDCRGDREGWNQAIAGAELIYKHYENRGWGHHEYNEIWRTPGFRFLHGECGGCSCGGSGSWGEYSLEEAKQRIPDNIWEKIDEAQVQ